MNSETDLIQLLNGLGIMGTSERRNREKLKRRQEIADAAKKVFARKGFKGATMEDIAREAELSPGTLYLYVKSKDELFASLNLQFIDFIKAKMDRLLANSDLKPAEKVSEMKTIFLELYEFDPFTFNFLIHLQTGGDLENFSPEFLSEIKERSGRGVRSIAAIFEEGIRKGAFSGEASPIALADIVWAGFLGLVVWENAKEILDPQKNFLNQTWELFIDLLGRSISKDVTKTEQSR
jgi:AcrR family transcriptional regulator